jgi:glutathione S-transferase
MRGLARFRLARALLLSAAMRSLLHMPLDPPSRKVRLILAEKGLPVRLVETPPWKAEGDLLAHNPAGAVPVLIDEPPTGGEIAVSPAPVIAEYLEEAYRSPALLPATSAGRAEVRRLAMWFESKFENEVNAQILRRRVDDRLQGRRRNEDDSHRLGAEAMRWHLDYLAWLLEGRAWLAGDKMTVADLAAAAHLSANDYLGAVPWTEFPAVKEWYQRLKCRPSFRPLLADRVDGVAPPPHYADLDF